MADEQPARRRRIKVTWSMDPDVVERATDAAWDARLSVSRFVETTLREKLEQMAQQQDD